MSTLKSLLIGVVAVLGATGTLSAQAAHPKGEVRHDRRELKADRHEVRQDRREVHSFDCAAGVARSRR